LFKDYKKALEKICINCGNGVTRGYKSKERQLAHISIKLQ